MNKNLCAYHSDRQKLAGNTIGFLICSQKWGEGEEKQNLKSYSGLSMTN